MATRQSQVSIVHSVGAGKRLEQLHELGIQTIGDLLDFEDETMVVGRISIAKLKEKFASF